MGAARQRTSTDSAWQTHLVHVDRVEGRSIETFQPPRGHYSRSVSVPENIFVSLFVPAKRDELHEVAVLHVEDLESHVVVAAETVVPAASTAEGNPFLKGRVRGGARRRDTTARRGQRDLQSPGTIWPLS